ncbi:MAG: hypothetical protein JWP88_1604 [Flaviaesturariibacter sp.]|nr:hypothetical protein [Flaviaesturariibacter sp.]
MKRTLIFLLLWGSWGFTLGTLLLMGPARWIINYIRLHHISEKKESMAMIGCIIVLFVISFVIALISTLSVLRTHSKSWSIALIAIPLVGAVLALAAFMNPKLMSGSSKQEEFGKGFTIGAYPDMDKMEELKKAGYTSIVSLLHPAVVPFEPKLLAEEKENAIRLGIQLVHIPMLPWIADNQTSIDSLRRFAAANKGKCYIHCYLGKDRVNVARRIIEQASGSARMDGGNFTHRTLDDVEKFERGPVIKLGDNVFLTPMPTQEEYLGYILAANYKQVVNLIDTTDPEAQVRIAEERKNLSALGIQYKVYHVNEATTPIVMEGIVKEVKSFPKPMIIHPFFSDRIEAKLFLEAYKKTP